MNTAAPNRGWDAASEPPTRKPPVPSKSKPPVSNRNHRLPASASATGSKRSSRESFHDNDTLSDTDRTESDYGNVRPPRDSHDLSLPSRNFTRDSLLGNMLNSLDQFSLSQINTPITPTFEEGDDEDDADLYGVPRGDAFARRFPNTPCVPSNTYAPRDTHEHGYRYSSDLEVFEDAASKISSRASRGRRSDSSSGVQSGLPRVNSMRERSYPGTSARPALHSRKSSGTASFDTSRGGHIQVLPTQRGDHAVGAPNHIVPEGHRRAPLASGSNPSISTLERESRTSERKKDTRSRSGTNKTTQPKYATARDAVPLPSSHNASPAPSPHVSYEKPKDTQQVSSTSAPPVKEKQGFFSRLFGSSRSNSNPAIEPVATPASSIVSEPPQQAVPETKPLSAPPTRDAETSRPAPHVIQKKSSFFRRRKKSIAEPPVPPLPPSVDISKTMNTAIPNAELSPVSSLREIMTPYLKSGTRDSLNPPEDSGARASAVETSAENNRKVRGFSPEYDPSPSATIRTVKSTSALKNKESRWLSQPESPVGSPPDIPATLANNPDSTFFHDSSDEGERRLGARPKQRQRPQTGKPASSGITNKSKATPLTGFDLPKSESSRHPPPQGNATEYDQMQVGPEMPAGNVRKPTSRPTLGRSGSNVPSVVVDSSQANPHVAIGPLDEPEVTVGEPTEDDHQKARGIFEGDENFIQKEKAAAWMGEEGLVRQRTLRAYMDLYDFENHSVLTALRQVCSRLVFRAETQQVDRILVAFSNRWCNCNPNHGFKTIDVIHTMCYSIMLLNTDLHLADIEQKMTRNQFVKNTMSTITQVVASLGPETSNPSGIPSKNSSLLSPANSEARTLADSEQDKPNWRASFKPLPRSESSQGFHADSGTSVDTCGPLVKAPFDGPMRAWEGQMEAVLKDIYASIRHEKLPLFGANSSYQQSQSQGGTPVMGRLKRSPSVLSKAPSESQASVRGRINDSNRVQGNRWISKSRSRPRLGNGFSSSRTSFEDTNSIWSPAASSATWSRHSLGRTQTSMSMDSFGSGYPTGDYQQSIGFANALSQAITRDDYPVGDSSQSILSEEFRSTQLLEDESLELLGPPWVKEGIVTHKHHLDGVDKKAKDRNWSEVFAVVQKGTMSIFSFSTKSTRQKARLGRKHAAGAVVGGGNWQENATSLGSFSLRHTLASALPAPGYSRTRPHVWALSLPSGAVHLFQVGTPEISKEFILTVNYWSARLSTHPLIGGISNIEYGWSDAAINSALIAPVEEPTMPHRPGSAAAGRPSTHSRQGSRQSSLRSSFDVGGGNARGKLPGDRIHIAEWTAPSQSLRPSQCSESEQLETLLAYVQSVEAEFQQHNQLRSPMLLAFTPRGPNAVKSMANWERKSSYLLREIVKFRTYADSLQHASDRRKEIYTERENARRAARGEDIDDSASAYSNDADTTSKSESKLPAP